MKKNLIYIILFTFTLISCKSQQAAEDKELYVSGYYLEDYNIPYVNFIYLENDSITLLNENLKEEKQLAIKEIIKEDIKTSFVINNNKISIIQQHLTNNQKSDYHYFKAQPDELSKASFAEKFLNKTFSTNIPKTLSSPNSDFDIVKSVVFQQDSVHIYYEYYYDDIKIYAEKESQSISYIEIDHRLFVSVNSETGISRAFQIVPTKNTFELISYGENKANIEKYQPTATIDSTTYNNFTTCSDARPPEYYHKNIGQKKGNQYLLREIQKNAPESGSDNGYITVHFTINCHQDVGRFGLEQMDRKYSSTKFNPELVKHLVNYIAELNEWENVEQDNLIGYQDIHSFYMFKIENGKITDICP